MGPITNSSLEKYINKSIVVTNSPVIDQVMADIEVLGTDLMRLGAASVTCVSLNTTLLVRTTVVTIEVMNVGSRIAVDELPALVDDTTAMVAALFAAKDDNANKDSKKAA